MLIPDWLYKLNASDQGKQLLEQLQAEATANDVAVTVGVTLWTVPKDRILFLSHVSAATTAGAGQSTDRIDITVATPDGSRQFPIHRASGGGNTIAYTDRMVNIILPPGYRVRATGVFNAGVNANVIEGNVFGIMIPRGTFIFTEQHP